MIRAGRVMEVVRFLKPGEEWHAVIGENLRLGVFDVGNGTATIEMTKPLMSISRIMNIAMMEVSWIGENDLLAFELVSMASQLGVYKDEGVE